MLTWSAPSSEVTKYDINTNPRRLVTHLLQQVVHYLTTRRGCGHGSATATRSNIRTTAQTMIVKASKASSEYNTMEASCGDPDSTDTGWV
jgi:aerobic-type carbon monoxide dehydrogenase small subunit (CoxS/CutS family)